MSKEGDMSGMFKRWNKNRRLLPQDISSEVKAEFGLKPKNSRQRYRAARKQEFLAKKRGGYGCFMLDGVSYYAHPFEKSELGEGIFIVTERPRMKKGGED